MYMEKCAPWFALYVKARHEKNVEQILKSKGLETFLPTYTKVHLNRKKFELPYFPSYLFCRIELNNKLPVISTPSVFSIVGTSREPEAVPEAEINDLRVILASGYRTLPWPYIAAGQEVQMNSGPLQGVRGTVVSSSSDKWLVISVHLLQRSIAVKVDRRSIDFVTMPVSLPALAAKTEILQLA
jgi:transcription antitermination factor NusG